MICTQCGANNEDQSTICIQCGAELPAQPPVEAEVPAEETKKSNKKLLIGLGAVGVLGIGAIAVLAVIAVIVVLVIIFCFNSPKEVSNDYMAAFLEPNMGAVMELVPEEVIDDSFNSDREKREYASEYNDSVQRIYDWLDEIYDEWEYTYEISHVDNVTDSFLDELQADYEDEYDLKVKKAKEITVTCTLITDGKETVTEVHFYVVKVGMQWYIDTLESDSPYEIYQDLFQMIIRPW